MYAHRTCYLISLRCGLYAWLFERSTQAWLERSAMCVIMHWCHYHYASVMDWGQLSLINCDFSTSTLRSLLLKGRTFIVSAFACQRHMLTFAWKKIIMDTTECSATGRCLMPGLYCQHPVTLRQGIFQCELHMVFSHWGIQGNECAQSQGHYKRKSIGKLTTSHCISPQYYTKFG